MDWGLTVCLWLDPPRFNYWFLFTLAHSRISHEYSSLFYRSDEFDFYVFALNELGDFMRTEF